MSFARGSVRVQEDSGTACESWIRGTVSKPRIGSGFSVSNNPASDLPLSTSRCCDTNEMIDLLRRTVERQTSGQLSYLRKDRLFHFRATEINKSRSYRYVANVNETSAKVVSAYANKMNPKGQGLCAPPCGQLPLRAACR
jgi:hypothetical protein